MTDAATDMVNAKLTVRVMVTSELTGLGGPTVNGLTTESMGIIGNKKKKKAATRTKLTLHCLHSVLR